MRRRLKKYKYHILLTMLLVAGSGCLGAVKKTNEQLTEEALKPITVPIEGYQRAKSATEGVNAAQAEKQRQIEEINGP